MACPQSHPVVATPTIPVIEQLDKGSASGRLPRSLSTTVAAPDRPLRHFDEETAFPPAGLRGAMPEFRPGRDLAVLDLRWDQVIRELGRPYDASIVRTSYRFDQPG